jgi:hypothetical protein
MVEITALVLDMVVDTGQLLDSPPAPIAGSFPPGYRSLHPAKLRLCGLVIPGIFDRCPVTENGKARNPHINACCVAGCRQREWVGNNDTKTGIPLPARFFRVTVLISPAIGRCSFTLSSPMPMM